jgi:hypothetical protein
MIAWPKARLDIQVFAAILRGTTVDGLALHRMRSQSAAMTKRLPHGDQAILDMRKIGDYCLNPSHPRGRHKARVFREALDLQRSDASWLRDALLEAHVPPKPSRMGRTLGGRIGASMRTSGDKEGVLW